MQSHNPNNGPANTNFGGNLAPTAGGNQVTIPTIATTATTAFAANQEVINYPDDDGDQRRSYRGMVEQHNVGEGFNLVPNGRGTLTMRRGEQLVGNFTHGVMNGVFQMNYGENGENASENAVMNYRGGFLHGGYTHHYQDDLYRYRMDTNFQGGQIGSLITIYRTRLGLGNNQWDTYEIDPRNNFEIRNDGHQNYVIFYQNNQAGQAEVRLRLPNILPTNFYRIQDLPQTNVTTQQADGGALPQNAVRTQRFMRPTNTDITGDGVNAQGGVDQGANNTGQQAGSNRNAGILARLQNYQLSVEALPAAINAGMGAGGAGGVAGASGGAGVGNNNQAPMQMNQQPQIFLQNPQNQTHAQQAHQQQAPSNTRSAGGAGDVSLQQPQEFSQFLNPSNAGNRPSNPDTQPAGGAYARGYGPNDVQNSATNSGEGGASASFVRPQARRGAVNLNGAGASTSQQALGAQNNATNSAGGASANPLRLQARNFSGVPSESGGSTSQQALGGAGGSAFNQQGVYHSANLNDATLSSHFPAKTTTEELLRNSNSQTARALGDERESKRQRAQGSNGAAGASQDASHSSSVSAAQQPQQPPQNSAGQNQAPQNQFGQNDNQVAQNLDAQQRADSPREPSLSPTNTRSVGEKRQREEGR